MFYYVSHPISKSMIDNVMPTGAKKPEASV